MPSPRTRDHGLMRVSQATRWLAAGSFAVAGLFSVLVARAFPGRQTTAKPGAATPSTSATTTTGGGPASGDSQSVPPLSPPGEAPAPSPAPAVVSSGGS